MSDHTADESIAKRGKFNVGTSSTRKNQMGTDYQGTQAEARFHAEMTKVRTRLAPIHAQQLHEQEVSRNKTLAEVVAEEQGRSNF